jgi:uncharacterized membrane protein
VAILIGVVVVTPAEFVAVLMLAIWVIIVSVLIALRSPARRHSGTLAQATVRLSSDSATKR